MSMVKTLLYLCHTQESRECMLFPTSHHPKDYWAVPSHDSDALQLRLTGTNVLHSADF